MRSSIIGRKGGFTLMGVGPSLLLWCALAGESSSGTSADITLAIEVRVTSADLPFPDQFPLFPTIGNEGASGMAYVIQPWSPYGVSVDEDGYVQYDLEVELAGLPVVTEQIYRVWITTPALDEIVLLGSLGADGRVLGANDWHQLMVVVSREPADRVVADGDRWNGPIVLRGFSAGARVTPMAQHSLFQQTPM